MIAAIVWVVFFFVPIPGMIINISIVSSIAFSLAVLLTAVGVKEWSDLRTFPLIMLYSTLFRIGLNIATTRKIISGESPGSVVERFGHVIVSDQILIGLVMFIIIIVVQFIIANGASRFGEVAARFALDGLPGKQMSIDNELAQKVIDEQTAKRRKRNLELQTDFYGNLDGAGKYIKGDVWASVVMIVINLIVGLIVGMVTLDMSFADAAKKFTMLTIGDGVINTICSLIITFSGALLMAKVEEEDEEKPDEDINVLQKILKEIVPNSLNLYIVGGVLIALSLTPLPFFPLFIPGILIVAGAFFLHRKRQQEEVLKVHEAMNGSPEGAVPTEPQLVKVQHSVDDITLRIGYKLATLFAAETSGETIQTHVLKMRQLFANMYGVEVPRIKIKDDITLYPSTKYVIQIKENTVASGELKENRALAMMTPHVISEVNGEETKDPIYGSDALWIEEGEIDRATAAGYDVWDPMTIIASHLHVVVVKHIHSLVDLQKVSDMVEEVGEEKPILKELVKKTDDLHLLHKVIISLLKERISIKDLPTILEGYLDARRGTEELDLILTGVRTRISRQLCQMNVHQDGVLYSLMLTPVLENVLPTKHHNGIFMMDVDFATQKKLVDAIKAEMDKAKAMFIEPALVVQTPELRPALSRMLQSFELEVNVLSGFEVVSSIPNQIIGYIELPEE